MNEAELLFSSVLNCDRLSLYLKKKFILDKENSLFISSVLKRRIQGEPIQYILGRADFMGFEFKVTPSVLIPRPETEILVETVAKLITTFHSQPADLRILDVGTGSGCIAVCLGKLFPGIKIDAIDLSNSALEIARENAALHNVSINFILSDLFSHHSLADNNYDCIASNPPYIASAELNVLDPEVQCEPRMALDGGMDGLCIYRRLIAGSLCHLKNSGLLIMEIGFNQAEGLKDIFQEHKDFEIEKVIRDYNNIERIIVARKKENNG